MKVQLKIRVLVTLTVAAALVATLVGPSIGPARSQPPKVPLQLPPQPPKTPPNSKPVITLPSTTPPASAPTLMPKLEPVAETKLLMMGLSSPNFKGLEKLLRDPPKDDQAWVYARGQALLIAETGNLLMLRPPRNQGEAAWFERAMELRTRSTALAKLLTEKNYAASRAEFVNLANSCNRCHQTFRVAVQIEPFAESITP